MKKRVPQMGLIADTLRTAHVCFTALQLGIPSSDYKMGRVTMTFRAMKPYVKIVDELESKGDVKV